MTFLNCLDTTTDIWKLDIGNWKFNIALLGKIKKWTFKDERWTI